MTYKCMSRMHVYGCLPRSHYQHNVPNSVFGLFFLFFLFYFSADNVKNLEHLHSALQEALPTLFLSWSGFLLTALWSYYKYKPHKHWNKEYGEAPKPQIDLWNPSRLSNVLCSFQLPRPGSSAAANKQQWGCCARAPVLHPLQGTGSEPSPAAGQLQPTGHQLQPHGLCWPQSIHKTLCSAQGRGTTSRPSRRKEKQLPIHFCCASLARPGGVRAHTTSPSGRPTHWAP